MWKLNMSVCNGAVKITWYGWFQRRVFTWPLIGKDVKDAVLSFLSAGHMPEVID
jgi:hypothetical protein